MNNINEIKKIFQSRYNNKHIIDDKLIEYINKMKLNTNLIIDKEYEIMVKELTMYVLKFVSLDSEKIKRLFEIIYILFLYDDFYIRAIQCKRYDIIEELSKIELFLSQNLSASIKSFKMHFNDYKNSLTIEQEMSNLSGIDYIRIKPKTTGLFLSFIYIMDLDTGIFDYESELLIYLAEKDMALVNDLFSLEKDNYAKNETNILKNEITKKTIIEKIDHNYNMMLEINKMLIKKEYDLIFAFINGTLLWSTETKRYNDYKLFINKIFLILNNKVLQG